MKLIPLVLMLAFGLISCRSGSDGVGTRNGPVPGQDVPAVKSPEEKLPSPAMPIASVAKTAPDGENVTFKGRLQSNDTDSTILYLGERSGDLAGFCFENTSDIGRRILATCRPGEICQFTGEVDYGVTDCPFDEGSLSAEARITKLKSVKRVGK